MTTTPSDTTGLAAPDGDPGQLPPLAPPGAAPDINAQLAQLQQQVAALLSLQQGQMQVLGGVLTAGIAARPTDDQLAAVAAAEPLPTPKAQPRVRIILEDNEQIPPGGQFIQVDGMPYMLQANMEVDVPVGLLDVLDHAVMSVPIVDDMKQVIGYRDRLRFPYRVIRDRALPDQE